MTEKELRQKVVDTAVSYLGCKEANGSHRKIIDLYNSHKPLARGYAVKYTDAWCSTFASAVAIACGLTDIIPTECGCERHIDLFKKLGSWVENDAYVPSPGDYIFYDWQDGSNYATTNNTGSADHVGIVVSCDGKTIKVIEGNMSDAVGYRKLAVNGRYIRGFGVPKYASKATSAPSGGGEASTPGKDEKPTPGLAVGSVVTFTGTKHYISSMAVNGKSCKPGEAKVTAVAKSGKHPYGEKYGEQRNAARAAKGPRIDKRDPIINSRTTFGHWEMDSVMGTVGSSRALVVLTERLTRAGIILPVPDHTAASVVRALNGLERRLGKDFYPMFQSITVDNGCEFQDYDGMEKACRRKGKRTTVYYCHPHAPHERGSNENMNRIIRRFFPKGTNFDEVPISEIRRAEEWMNNYPREVLGWQTAATLLRSYMSAC